MNSFRQPRKRPRVDSVCFRTFGWVLLREAYLSAIAYSVLGGELNAEWRRFVAKLPTPQLRRRLELFLERHPERRIVG